MPLSIRPATPEDAGLILTFIRELAEYEKLLHEVQADEAQLRATLFAPTPKVFARIAEAGGEPVGFALYFFNYSTFLGKHGLYIEDVYVRPAYRGCGYGTELFRDLARIALSEGCGRMEWWVLDWNDPAIAFYRKLGAEPMSDWTVFRLTRDALEPLAVTP
jgi:GNAT superfamily N-acetyltransferase